MITEISFDNFKCLSKKGPFYLSKLNVFSGYNGRGKSSVMQFLLMLSQSIRKDQNQIRKLHLNGDYVNLGDFDEIMTDDTGNDVSIEFKTNDPQIKEVQLSYQLSNEDIKIGLIDKCIINSIDYFDIAGGMNDVQNSSNKGRKDLFKTPPTALTNLFQNIYYVSANRQGSVKYEDRQEVPEFLNVGAYGDRTINTMVAYKELIKENMNVPGQDGEHKLSDLVNLWVEYIMNGGGLEVENDNAEGRHNSVLTIDFKFKDFPRTFNSYNVGFGYSYILSIVVTALIAKPGSIVIVENPEAHLHPEAQLRLTELLSKLSANGVQVFIETHSEHILNGFRITTLKDEFDINTSDISIYFFDRDFSIKHLKVLPNGKIPNWPKGFFNQFETEMSQIITLGSKVICK